MDLLDILLIGGGNLTDEELEELITMSDTMEFIEGSNNEEENSS